MDTVHCSLVRIYEVDHCNTQDGEHHFTSILWYFTVGSSCISLRASKGVYQLPFIISQFWLNNQRNQGGVIKRGMRRSQFDQIKPGQVPCRLYIPLLHAASQPLLSKCRSTQCKHNVSCGFGWNCWSKSKAHHSRCHLSLGNVAYFNQKNFEHAEIESENASFHLKWIYIIYVYTVYIYICIYTLYIICVESPWISLSPSVEI